MGCECDNFSPPIKVTTEQLGELRINNHRRVDEFCITKHEAAMLHEFFMRIGYIGHEFEWDLTTHEIIRKLSKFLGNGSKRFGVDK